MSSAERGQRGRPSLCGLVTEPVLLPSAHPHSRSSPRPRAHKRCGHRGFSTSASALCPRSSAAGTNSGRGLGSCLHLAWSPWSRPGSCPLSPPPWFHASAPPVPSPLLCVQSRSSLHSPCLWADSSLAPGPDPGVTRPGSASPAQVRQLARPRTCPGPCRGALLCLCLSAQMLGEVRGTGFPPNPFAVTGRTLALVPACLAPSPQ